MSDAPIIIAGLLAGVPLYLWKKSVIQPREISTSLEPGTVRGLFDQHIASTGWKIVSSGQKTVAESPAIAMRKQQIAMELRTQDGRTIARIYPCVFKIRYGVPSKAGTLDFRIRKLITAISALDSSAKLVRETASTKNG
jgi:hypothetical protein